MRAPPSLCCSQATLEHTFNVPEETGEDRSGVFSRALAGLMHLRDLFGAQTFEYQHEQAACAREHAAAAIVSARSSLAGRCAGHMCRSYIRCTRTVVVCSLPCSMDSVFDVPVSPLGPTFCVSVGMWWPHVVRYDTFDAWNLRSYSTTRGSSRKRFFSGPLASAEREFSTV